MKTPLVLALLAGSTYLYFHGSASPTAAELKAARAGHTLAAPAVTVAAAPSSYDRWKTGPNAQTDLKTGPNAQTELATGLNAQTNFQPFAPTEHATWNHSSGSTFASGRAWGRRISTRIARR